jgi:hypothetical protein
VTESEGWHKVFPLPLVLVAFGKKDTDSQDPRQALAEVARLNELVVLEEVSVHQKNINLSEKHHHYCKHTFVTSTSASVFGFVTSTRSLNQTAYLIRPSFLTFSIQYLIGRPEGSRNTFLVWPLKKLLSSGVGKWRRGLKTLG